MVKNKKGILITVIVLVIIYFTLVVISLFPGGKKYISSAYIGANTKVVIENGNIKVYNVDEKISRQEVKIYFKKKFIDGYILTKKGDTANGDNIYVIYDNDMNSLLPDSTLFACTKDLDIKIIDSEKNMSYDLESLITIASNNNIILSQDVILDYLEISSFDLEEDGSKEYVYSIGLIDSGEKYISFVSLLKDNKYELIAKQDSSYGESDHIRLRFYNPVDFNNDGKYEFVINKIMSEYGPEYYELYTFSGNNFTRIGVEE